ncbi:MAG TPA: hypothetical protein VGM56_07905 [Byssovorax sp.]|jgi:hypothetical protein
MVRSSLGLALAATLVLACSSSSSTDPGGAGAGDAASTTSTASTSATTSTSAGAGGADNAPCDTTPTFHEVLAGPLSSCSGLEPPCHNASAGYLTIDPMNASNTYHALVGVPATISGAGDRVVPGDVDGSFLFRKLTNDLTPHEQDPMPKPPNFPGATWMELPADQIEMVRCWIVGGAMDD